MSLPFDDGMTLLERVASAKPAPCDYDSDHVCEDCELGLGENGLPCVYCGGWGVIPCRCEPKLEPARYVPWYGTYGRWEAR